MYTIATRDVFTFNLILFFLLIIGKFFVSAGANNSIDINGKTKLD